MSHLSTLPFGALVSAGPAALAPLHGDDRMLKVIRSIISKTANFSSADVFAGLQQLSVLRGKVGGRTGGQAGGQAGGRGSECLAGWLAEWMDACAGDRASPPMGACAR